MTKVLFNTQKDVIEYQFTQGMQTKESDMTNVLFDIQNNNNMKLDR